MSTAEERFHEEWLGMVQPVDGLVVSIPVLVEAQCLSRQPADIQRRLAELCGSDPVALADVPAFLADVLGWTAERQLSGDALPLELSLYVPEGQQTIRPTLALRATPEAAPVVVFWDLGRDAVGLSLDKPETTTGPWEYPVAAKLDRLLRHARIPIGVLTNRTHVRLMYAPHGESSGSITFRVADMLEVGGRPILDAMVMLLGATRLWGVAPERQLPAILSESRKRQANVTNELADQVFDALQILLRGFEAAAERDGREVLDAAYARAGDHLYGGLLTQLLRLVFVLYAEDRGLLPVESELYAEHFSVLGLFEQLQADHGAHPDSMSRRFGAYARLCALFRAVFLGVEHGDLKMPARRGQLFSPHEYPFLEGWAGEPGSAPIIDPGARADVRVPSVDDETVFRVLEKLLVLRRQRLSYRALDVEQIGSVYEALMGYHVVRLEADAVCLRPSRVWLSGDEVVAEKPATRAKWLQETTGMAKGQADKLHKALGATKKPADALEALSEHAVSDKDGTPNRRAAGSLVIQPGPERRRTSSHYTPRSLTAPIVAKTLEPLFRAMGDNPPSERILNLKVCDPAMGSGAFLVEACRYLADEVVLAWTREGRHDLLAGSEDATLIARRLVAQRCLYGVDKNAYAVNLAKLSLWLVTLAKALPFTFVDHALRHGDSLVGLSFEQITAFHWKPKAQVELCATELKATLDEAILARQRILDLAADASPAAQKEKEWLLKDAEDALDRVRLIGDLVVGAFFAKDNDKDREEERRRRLDLVLAWLRDGGPPEGDLLELRAEFRTRVPVFHWMAEYPEVFWVRRPDPLAGDRADGAAWIDAFIGNPPFLGVSRFEEDLGGSYLRWTNELFEGAGGKTDLCAYFFRLTDRLLGEHGCVGLLATNSICEGDTRQSGLGWLVDQGARIYAAQRSMPWPGQASVSVSVVHLAKGLLVNAAQPAVLDGKPVAQIDSSLRDERDRGLPEALTSNAKLSYLGAKPYGEGFVLVPEEAQQFIRRDKVNAEVIRPYVGGEDVNESFDGEPRRFVIDFGERELSVCETQWPDLVDHLRRTVKPLRDKNKRATYRERWWLFGERQPALFRALPSLRRCLVASQVSKHLVLAWQPVDRVLAISLNVFLLERDESFGVLQSRVHEAWARRYSSTLEDRLRYTTTDCFVNFPFPYANPRSPVPLLERIGKTLYNARGAYMRATQHGLTQTYNRLKDPDCSEPDVVALRNLHLELDRAVLTAYGWTELIPHVPPYTTPRTEDEKRAVGAFDDAVIDRLFELNAERAAHERATDAASVPAPAAPAAGKPKRGGKRSKAATTDAQLAISELED